MQTLEALQKFLIQLEADGRSHHTIRQYNRHVRLFANWAADVGHCGDTSEISHEDVAQFLNASVARTRLDGGLKKATSVNALRTSLKGFFGYLHKAGFITQDPSRLTRRAICGAPPPRALSNEEKDRLMDALLQGTGPEARRDYALFHLMLATGIRLGSALALDVEDVDFDSGEIWLKSTKGDQPERVFLGKAIRKHLSEYMSEGWKGPLFTGQTGKRLSSRHVQRRFSHWLQKASIKRHGSPHCLRHTFATSLYLRTADIFLVKEGLRHRSIMSTLVYTGGDEEKLRRILDE